MEILGLVNVPLWLLIVIALCLLLYIYGVRNHDVFTKMGMDGPKPWPLLGNSPYILWKGFVESNEVWFKKYGRVFGIFEGNHPLIYVGDVEMLKDITVKDFNKFPNRRTFKMDKYLDRPISEFLTLLKDDDWRHNRNTLTPSFSGGKLKRMMDCIVDAATTFTKNLKPVADSEEPTDIKLYTGAFTMDTIAASAFGMKLDTKTTPDDPFIVQAKKFFEFSVLSPVVMLMFFFPFLMPLVRIFKIRLVPSYAVEFFSEVTNRALNERRSNPGKYFDFLQLMVNAEKEAQNLSNGHSDKDKSSETEDASSPYWRDKRKGQGLTDSEILAAAILFFTAGYETTATTLVHAFFHLAHHPEMQNKLIAEIDEHYPNDKPPDYETIGELQYLDMVVMETLRINPPLGRMDRLSSKDAVVHGYKIPAGVGVALPIYMIHHDPGYWPDPETFDPERFTPENREKHHPLQWIPFGYGPRNCIGMRLALLEIKIALVKFFQKYRIATNSKTVPLKFGENAILSVQKGGVWLTVKHRPC